MARYDGSTDRHKQLSLSIEVQAFLYEEKVAIIALFGVDYVCVSKTLTKVCTPCHPEPGLKDKEAPARRLNQGGKVEWTRWGWAL